MPGFNGRGPSGDGAMSGRGQGRCSGSAQGQGMFFGGRGLGRNQRAGMSLGRRNFTPSMLNKEEEINILKESSEMLKMQLEIAQKQISKLENK